MCHTKCIQKLLFFCFFFYLVQVLTLFILHLAFTWSERKLFSHNFLVITSFHPLRAFFSRIICAFCLKVLHFILKCLPCLCTMSEICCSSKQIVRKVGGRRGLTAFSVFVRTPRHEWRPFFINIGTPINNNQSDYYSELDGFRFVCVCIHCVVLDQCATAVNELHTNRNIYYYCFKN